MEWDSRKTCKFSFWLWKNITEDSRVCAVSPVSPPCHQQQRPSWVHNTRTTPTSSTGRSKPTPRSTKKPTRNSQFISDAVLSARMFLFVERIVWRIMEWGCTGYKRKSWEKLWGFLWDLNQQPQQHGEGAAVAVTHCNMHCICPSLAQLVHRILLYSHSVGQALWQYFLASPAQ